ncbi:hypothetical protein AA310_12375 [Arthrobacter sp. YC-RL1]|uniref:DUF7448 domain-containing protein n=1 Tax=Arthrobacter sp. YC-RL1 TaxID=1652545 RepID=UPI00063DB08A|nr:hypothetical protein [Arthrobacter sp. YC-RL1]KLI88579.1 hypothetical protein AA310_12375 [Arthrobacter sp. YC-RL1]
MDNRIYDLESDDLAKVLIGKRITGIDERAGSIKLEDGTQLIIEDSADCCAYFGGDLKKIDLTENAITAIRHDDLSTGEYDEHWKLTVLSVDKEVCAIEIDGDSGSGYYCHSINLIVRKPKIKEADCGDQD